jgi:cytidylate kinase
LIVTIDGPAGAGKSSAAKGLAERLGFEFLDTGAMYRAVTFVARRAGIDAADESSLRTLLADAEIVVERGKTTFNGEDISEAIRTPEVTSSVRNYADKGVVRERLTAWQRKIGERRDLVTEGRDQGTVVFPHAECKFFLIASDEVRAQRRHKDFAALGREIPLETVLADQQARDRQDSERALAPLKPADDAEIIDTSPYDLAGVIDLLEQKVRGKMASNAN